MEVSLVAVGRLNPMSDSLLSFHSSSVMQCRYRGVLSSGEGKSRESPSGQSGITVDGWLIVVWYVF